MNKKLDAKNFEELTKESVLRNKSVLELFKYYIPEFKEVGKRFKSNLRKDNNPSCVIYDSGLYIDFGSGEKFDIFGYIQKKYLCNFYESLKIVNNDFKLNLGEQSSEDPLFFGVNKIKKEKIIEYKSKPFTKEFLDYFIQYGITKDTLDKFWVKQLQCYWYNKKLFNVYNELCVLYPEVKIDKWVYKIYLPNKTKQERFPVSNDGGAIYGLRQLPESGDHLFITSSKKDIMTLYSLGYPSISGTSETVLFTVDLIDHLKTRFKKISCFYDYDKTGFEQSMLLMSTYDLNDCLFTYDEQNKDPSDYYKNIGKEKLEWKIKNYLEGI